MKLFVLAGIFAVLATSAATAGSCQSVENYKLVVVDDESLAKASVKTRRWLKEVPVCFDAEAEMLHIVGVARSFPVSHRYDDGYVQWLIKVVDQEVDYELDTAEPDTVYAYILD